LLQNKKQLPGILLVGFTCLLWGMSCTKKKPVDQTTEPARKVLYHLREAEEKSLDPMKQFDTISSQLVGSLYDTLFNYHYLKRPYALEPLLLAQMPERQADGRSYLFTLKKGVMFHDNACFSSGKGRELKSDDVIYSMKRFADINVNRLSYNLISGLVVGMDQFREISKIEGSSFRYDKQEIEGVKKRDDYTFVINFVQDSPLNFHPLAFNGLAIVPREAVEKYGDDFDKNPVGTGPFMMKTYSRRGTTILVKNPLYHAVYPSEGTAEDKAAGLLEPAGQKLPFVDEVQLPLMEETQPQLLKFKKGQLAYVNINRDDFELMVDRKDGKEFQLKKDFIGLFDLFYASSLQSSFVRLGMRDEVIGKNKALRQAIALAMNAEGYTDLMFNGRGHVAHSLVPLDIVGSVKDTKSIWYTQNLEAAQKKLAEAGYPGGKGLPPLKIEYRSTSKDQRLRFEYIRNELSRVGIRIEGNFQSFSNYLKKTDEGNFQLADAGWNADYPDAENFYALFYGKNIAPGPNGSNFINPKYDEFFVKARHLKDGPERIKLFAEMDAVLKEEVPVILLMHQIIMGLKQKNLKNFKRSMMEEHPYKYMDLAN